MDAQRLKQLLSREESEKLDFKACLKLCTESDKKELVKDVTAIANSRGGRVISSMELKIRPSAFSALTNQTFRKNKSSRSYITEPIRRFRYRLISLSMKKNAGGYHDL